MDAGVGFASMSVMAIRLYESAWVRVEGSESALLVQRDRKNAAAFHVGDHQYDIDGRPLRRGDPAPAIIAVLSLQAAREAGLATEYNRDMR